MSKSPQLPFKEFEKSEIATRDIVRKHESVTMSRQTYQIKIAAIQVREGFNARKFYTGIEELADMIFANGIVTPLNVDILKDGTIYVERGHRRLAALKLLQERHGDYMEYVECFVNNSNTTELERLKAIYTSNTIQPLSPVENAEVVNRLKVYYELNHQQIAAELGISRQSVDNYAKIAELPDDVKQGLADERISLNSALSIVRKLKDDVVRAEAFENLLSGKNTNLNSSASVGVIGKEIKEDPEEDNEQLTTDSEQVTSLNECIGMLDKMTVKCAPLKESNEQFVQDMEYYISAILHRIEETKKHLIKTQH